MPEDPARSGAQAVERALSILNVFREGPADVGITELADRTGLRVSTAHRIVRALTRAQFLEQDSATDRYRLGRSLAVLGQLAIGSLGFDLVVPALQQLARTTGESAALGLRQGNDTAVMLVASSQQPLRFDHQEGARVPLHASAMGKAMLAFCTEDLREAVAGLGDLTRFTGHTLVTTTRLLADLEATRERGYSVNSEERYAGVCAVAAPVLDDAGLARAAVGVQGPTARLSPATISGTADQVMATADAVAHLLPLDRL